jgi:hypothetical protein
MALPIEKEKTYDLKVHYIDRKRNYIPLVGGSAIVVFKNKITGEIFRRSIVF